MATKFQALQKKASGVCAGKTTLSAVREAAKAYVKDAVEKGVTKGTAEKTANRQIARASKCSIGAAKKRKSTAKPKVSKGRKPAKRTTKRK